ncbi:MAG TPA: heme biosynthesis HemY N-terminal domain-containing protein [Gammaproteobacteria bacterium]|nr:heme biosynthesis HemY N-terminal domain-containing protein [Gammaproteobacteria bacterium]
MRFGFLGLAVLVLGALIAQVLLQDRGYVLVDFRGYAVEMSVPGLVLVLAALYAVVRALTALLRVPAKVGVRVARRRVRLAGARLSQALLVMAEGDWAKGERLLSRGLKGAQAPLAHYLLAARAAQAQGSRERRDEWLKSAYERMPKAETAILLMRAELQLEGGEHARALATLRRVERQAPGHPRALAMHARTCAELGEHRELAELLPKLGRRPRLDGESLLRIALPALEEALSGPELTRSGLDAYWTALPPPIRKSAEAIALRARSLDRLGHGERAERELRAALKRQWREPLIDAFADVRGKDRVKQLKFTEDRLKEHPEDAALLAAAAKLCMESELWGKARSYLESSLALAPAPARYALYGRLLDRLGEGQRAALAFRSGLALLEHGRAEVPALTGPGVAADARLAEGA